MASKVPKYIMRHSTLLHRQVVDSISRQSLGRVTDLWIDLRQHRVIGFSSHAEYGGISLRSYFWKQIEAIEAQQIVVQSLPTIHPRLILNINPETGMAVKDPLALGIWNQRGDWMGEIIDFRFDANSGTIDYYVCAPHSNVAKEQQLLYLSASILVDGGQGRLFVPDQVLQQIKFETEELSLLPSQVALASSLISLRLISKD